MRANLAALILGSCWVLGCSRYEPASPSAGPSGAPQAQAKAPAAQAAAAQAPSAPAPAPAGTPSSPAGQSGLTTNMTAAAGAAGVAPLDMMGGPSGVAPAGSAPGASQTQPSSKPAVSYQKADVGVGKQGRGYDQSPVVAPITVPVATYFASKEMIVFRVQIPDAMRLYKATNGSAPKTHEEFMQQIIQANNIRLPDLPPGDRYVYDPAREELMVERRR